LTGELARYWIETGAAETIMTRIRNELAARRDMFTEIFKGCRFRCELAAPYAWLTLPPGWTSGRFSTLLAAHGVKVTPGTAFQLGAQQTGTHQIRICFGRPARASQIRHAFETIRSQLDEHDDDDFTPVA
jgi:DNA-binding transcriptional MocR family regulator